MKPPTFKYLIGHDVYLVRYTKGQTNGEFFSIHQLKWLDDATAIVYEKHLGYKSISRNEARKLFPKAFRKVKL